VCLFYKGDVLTMRLDSTSWKTCSLLELKASICVRGKLLESGCTILIVLVKLFINPTVVLLSSAAEDDVLNLLDPNVEARGSDGGSGGSKVCHLTSTKLTAAHQIPSVFHTISSFDQNPSSTMSQLRQSSPTFVLENKMGRLCLS
jgi:hypothetical protein